MTALEGELDACGGADAPPSAAARLKEVLAESLRTGRTELAKPRSGLDLPVEVALAVHNGALLAATPAAATLRADPRAVPEREWLLVAAVVGTLVELSGGGTPSRPEDLRLKAGELPGGFLVLAYPDGELDAELLALAFDEHAHAIDRLRANALALPPHVIDDVPLKEPIGARHPLKIAEAVARLGGRPAGAHDDYEEAVLAVLGPGGESTRPHEDPDRPSALPAGSCSGSTAWGSGADITPSSPISREALPATTARSRRRWGRPCWRPACWPRSPPSASATSTSIHAGPRRSAS